MRPQDSQARFSPCNGGSAWEVSAAGWNGEFMLGLGRMGSEGYVEGVDEVALEQCMRRRLPKG